jgi:hypothetical protein
LANRSSQKLSFKYFGPFLVLKKVGNVSYKLQLPGYSCIHPVVHVSQLKRAIKPTEVSIDLPVALLQDLTTSQPLEILAEHFIHRGNKQVPQVRLR